MTHLTRHHTPEPLKGVPVKEVRRRVDWLNVFVWTCLTLFCLAFWFTVGRALASLIGG